MCLGWFGTEELMTDMVLLIYRLERGSRFAELKDASGSRDLGMKQM